MRRRATTAPAAIVSRAAELGLGAFVTCGTGVAAGVVCPAFVGAAVGTAVGAAVGTAVAATGEVARERERECVALI